MTEPTPDATGTSEGSGTAEGPGGVDRRSFVRAIAGESVTTAGRLAGLSGFLAGSMVAAGKAAQESLSALGDPVGGAVVPPTPAVPHPKLRVPPPPAAAAAPAPPPPIADADRAVLEAATLGLLSTNQPGGPPATGIARFRFVEGAFLVPGRSATARTTNLQRDPFASMTVIDPETGDALLAAGRARIVYREEGREGAAAVLEACGVELPDGWDATDSRGEPVLVVLELSRLFRRRPGDERP